MTSPCRSPDRQGRIRGAAGAAGTVADQPSEVGPGGAEVSAPESPSTVRQSAAAHGAKNDTPGGAFGAALNASFLWSHFKPPTA